jgi:hypothetical protein
MRIHLITAATITLMSLDFVVAYTKQRNVDTKIRKLQNNLVDAVHILDRLGDEENHI